MGPRFGGHAVGRGFRIAVCAGSLLCQAAAVHAESWSIVEGSISLKKGKSSSLSGTFEGSVDPGDGPPLVVLNLDDFAFTAGRKELAPRIPVEYEGLLPVAWLQIGDVIIIDGEQVAAARIRSGGKLVDESD